jgi:hypothetical protein
VAANYENVYILSSKRKAIRKTENPNQAVKQPIAMGVYGSMSSVRANIRQSSSPACR